jgi:hypothetical protein
VSWTFARARREGADDDRDAARGVLDRDLDHAPALGGREADEFPAAADHQQAGGTGIDLEIDQPAECRRVEFVGRRERRDDGRGDPAGRERHQASSRLCIGARALPASASTDQSSDSSRNRHSAIQ